MTDAPDFTDKYNTELSPQDEQAFREWIVKQRVGPGTDARRDLYDYDLRGWWKQNGSQTLTGAHLTDEFKKPNHPTFSDESKYHGVDGHEGGTWQGSDKEGWTFLPGRTNVEMHGQEGLQRYFSQNEPNADLAELSLEDRDRLEATKRAFESGQYYRDESGNLQIRPPGQ